MGAVERTDAEMDDTGSDAGAIIARARNRRRQQGKRGVGKTDGQRR
jgi:hypothetical protein